MSILLKRLEALEATHAATRARLRPIESAAERAELLQSYVWDLSVFDERCRGLAPAGDGGYWPYRQGGGATRLLRVDALQPMYDATHDDLIEMLLRMAARVSALAPAEGGEVPFFFDKGDTEPFVRFWYAPTDGADLL